MDVGLAIGLPLFLLLLGVAFTIHGFSFITINKYYNNKKDE